MAQPWENDIAELLNELSLSQGELLKLLNEKRKLMVAADTKGLEALGAKEEEIVQRLQACHQRRGELLAAAEQEGKPADSLSSLASSLADGSPSPLKQQINDASSQSRLLQHESLTNWVIAQRSLLHISQILEIIATGGRPVPTYSNDQTVTVSGSLVDHAA